MKRPLLGDSSGSSAPSAGDQVTKTVIDAIEGSDDKVIEIRPAKRSSGWRRGVVLLLIGGVVGALLWRLIAQDSDDIVQEVANKTSELTEQLADQAAETVRGGGENIADQVDGESQKIADQFEEESQKAGDQIEQVGEDTAGIAEDAGEKLSGKAGGSSGSDETYAENVEKSDSSSN